MAFTGLIRLLRRYGLVRGEPATLVLHRLLAAILRAQPHRQPDLPILALRLLRAAVPADDLWENPQAGPAWRQLLPHVLVATESHRTLPGVEEDVAWLLHRAASYLQTRGEATPARPLLERAWELRRSLLGEDHPETLESAGSLSFNLWEVGLCEQGRRLGEDTLTHCRRVLGDDHPHTLRAASSLSLHLWELGLYEQGRQLGEDTLTRCRRVLGADHSHTLISANSLATALRELGQYERARRLIEDTLARMRRILGDGHPHTLRSAHKLAAVLADVDGHDQGRQLGRASV